MKLLPYYIGWWQSRCNVDSHCIYLFSAQVIQEKTWTALRWVFFLLLKGLIFLLIVFVYELISLKQEKKVFLFYARYLSTSTALFYLDKIMAEDLNMKKKGNRLCDLRGTPRNTNNLDITKFCSREEIVFSVDSFPRITQIVQ